MLGFCAKIIGYLGRRFGTSSNLLWESTGAVCALAVRVELHLIVCRFSI
jgi:hypothetical protein